MRGLARLMEIINFLSTVAVSLRSGFRPRRVQWLGLFFVLLIATLLRLWQINQLPPGLYNDEAFFGLEAWRILTDPAYRPIFITGHSGVPPLNAYANAVTFAVFRYLGGPVGPTTLRVTAACFGILGVLALYAAAVELRKLAYPHVRLSAAFPLLAAATLAVMRWHLHYSRIGIEPILVPLTWSATIWLLLRGWRTGRWWDFAGCGLALAAGVYSYQGAWVIPFLMAPIAGHLLFAAREPNPDRSTRPLSLRRRYGLGVTMVVTGLCLLPLLWLFWQNSAPFVLRLNQLYVAQSSQSPDVSLWHNIWVTTKMFGPFGRPGDLDPLQNIPGAPALNFWLAIPFYVGLMIALWRIRRPTYSIVLISLAGLLLPGILSRDAPHFHRVLGATAPVALLCGLGLDWIWQGAEGMGARTAITRRLSRPYLVRGAAIFLVTAGGLLSAYHYFVTWATHLDRVYDFNAHMVEVVHWAAVHATDDPIFLSTRGSQDTTLEFIWQSQHNGEQKGVPKLPIQYDGQRIFPFDGGATSRPEAYIVIEDNDTRMSRLFTTIFPTAPITKEFSDSSGQIYARVYVRPANTLPAPFPPQFPLVTPLGDGVTLQGYDLSPISPHSGASLFLQFHWLASERPLHSWIVLSQVVNVQTGQVVASSRHRTGYNSLTTKHWESGWRLLDEHEIFLPAGLSPGRYGLRVSLERGGGARMPDSAAGLELGTVDIAKG